MPRGERSTPPDMFKEAMDASVDREVKKKATEQLYYDRFGALVDKINKREKLTDSKEQQEMEGNIAADVSFLAEKMPAEHEELYEREIADFKKKLKKSTGPSKNYLKKLIPEMEEALERIRGERLVEIPEPPEQTVERGKGTEDEKSEYFETDRTIAEEQRQLALNIISEVQVDLSKDTDISVSDQKNLDAICDRLDATVQAYDRGELPARDFVTDAALVMADLNTLREEIEGRIATQSVAAKERHDALEISRELVTQTRLRQIEEDAAREKEDAAKEAAAEYERNDALRIARELATQTRLRQIEEDAATDVAAAEITGIADGIAQDERRAPLVEKKRNVLDEPPENLPIAQERAQPPKPIESTRPKNVQIDKEYSAEVDIQEKVDYFLTLDTDGREEMQEDIRSQMETGTGSLGYEGWSRADLYNLNKKIEALQASSRSVERKEEESLRAPQSGEEKAVRRLEQQVLEILHEIPNGRTELMKVHTGGSWETFTPKKFATRYLELLNKNVDYNEARAQRSFLGRVGRLFGRKGPEEAIMNKSERDEFGQMDAIMEELGIEKSTYSTATPSIR